jgi:general secretion pathway protein E
MRDRSGALTLAIARPIEDETIRAAEIALQREVTIAVATADDIDAALATTLEAAATKEPAATAGPPPSSTLVICDLARPPVARAR